MENVSLIFQSEEMENEKLQINENICKLHVELLNLKIQNELLTQESSTTKSQINNLEKEKELQQTNELKKRFRI